MHEPAEKDGLRNAWGRVADVYTGMWADRTAHVTARGLDLLAPERGARGVDVACGPGVTTVALAERLDGGPALGVDSAPEMVHRASARFAGRDDLAVDDAEHLSLAPKSAEVVTCSFGLMYCYDAAAALRSTARTLRPGGRMLQVVWGHASNVWRVPVIELIESRARHFSAVCPMMFFYGPPGVMPRMVDGAGLDPIEQVTLETTMAFAGFDDALDTAIHRGPLAGPYRHRLDADAQAEVLEAMRSHLEGMAVRDADGIRLPAEASLTVAARPARIS